MSIETLNFNILTTGDSLSLANDPTKRPEAVRAALDGMREIYRTCGVPEADIQKLTSNPPTEIEPSEILIGVAQRVVPRRNEIERQLTPRTNNAETIVFPAYVAPRRRYTARKEISLFGSISSVNAII